MAPGLVSGDLLLWAASGPALPSEPLVLAIPLAAPATICTLRDCVLEPSAIFHEGP